MGARGGRGFPRAGSHLSFRCSAMADQVGIWGGCPRRLEVLASDEVDLDPDPDQAKSNWRTARLKIQRYSMKGCSSAGVRLHVGWNTNIMRVRHAREVWYGAHISQPVRTSKKHCDARCHRHLSPTSRQAEGDLRRRRSIARCRSQERRGSSAGECLAPAARKKGEAPWWARLKRLALFDPHPAPPNFLMLPSPRGSGFTPLFTLL